jgi:hypothetical protein
MMSERTPEPCTVSIPTGIDLAIEARVYRADGDGPHPALALADGVAPSAVCFADEGFTAIVFAEHLPRARTPVISYPVLVIVGGTEDYERLVRRMAKRAHRIEVYVATSRARTVGVETDFLRFHSSLRAAMHEVC